MEDYIDDKKGFFEKYSVDDEFLGDSRRERFKEMANSAFGVPKASVDYHQDGMIGILSKPHTFNPHSVLSEDPEFIGDLGYRDDDITKTAYVHMGTNPEGKRYYLVAFKDSNSKTRISRGTNLSLLRNGLYQGVKTFGFQGLLGNKKYFVPPYENISYYGAEKVKLPLAQVKKAGFLSQLFSIFQ